MKFYIKIFLQKLIALAVLPLRLFPIRRNRILFLSLEGGSSCEYSCNPRYLCDYILRTAPAEFELVWLFRKPEDYHDLTVRGVKTAKHFTLKGFYYCLTSRIVITNGGYLTWFPFRKGQVRINTWHGGGAYKRLENDRAGANHATAKRMDYCNRNTTAFVSSSEKFTEHAILGAFRYTGEVLPIGMPRNDIFFSQASGEWYEKIRVKFRIPSKARILLYAPTFREETAHLNPISASSILKNLTESTGEDWYILYRSHTKTSGTRLMKDLTNHCIDGKDYPDTQELLCAADLLLTDYSSIVWDYCLTNRPVILYTPDLEDYLRLQGFYLDIRNWGFPICRNPEELYEMCGKIMCDPALNGSGYHQELLGSAETGHACEALLAYIRKQM